MAYPEKPFERSYWVVPGKLLAGCYPGSRDPVEASEKLGGLLECGIRCVVNLMEDHEKDYRGEVFVNYEKTLTKMAQDKGIRIELVRLPIADNGVPSKAQMIKILDSIDNAVNRGLPVYVHCWGGVGRTGTVVGCYLARHGFATGPSVIKKIAELRRKDPTAYRNSPEIGPQSLMVTSWAAGD